VFDKVRENQRVLTATGRTTYSEMVNKSLNAVLMRSLSTSFVALMPVLSLLIVGAGIFGATSLEDFALALAAGLFIGSYSSIFVAAPILAWWKEREPQYRSLAERRARGGPATPVPSSPRPPSSRAAMRPQADAPAGVAVADDAAAVEVDEVAQRGLGVAGPAAVGRTIQPRARQQRRRKRK
jgi:preprotein translocase subunit SecF